MVGDVVRTDTPPREAVAAGLQLWSTVDVWHAGEVTALGVPVVTGRYVAQRDQDVPERVDLTLPHEWNGLDLHPGRRRSLLGSDGHRLQLTVHQATDGGQYWKSPVGFFPVQDTDAVGAGVRVMAHGMLRLVKDRLRAAPRSPGKISPIAGELMKEFADLGMQVRVHPDLPLRPVPKDFVFGSDRLASIQELVTAWPARMRVDPLGVVEFLPPLRSDQGPAVAQLVHGEGGTLVGAPFKTTREGTYNHVIVRVKPEGDAPEWEHEDWVRTGRMRPEVYDWRSREVESNAIKYPAQAQSIAWQELTASQVRQRVLPIEMVADWGLQLDDVATARTAEEVNETGLITGIDWPLTAADGLGRIDLGVID